MTIRKRRPNWHTDATRRGRDGRARLVALTALPALLLLLPALWQGRQRSGQDDGGAAVRRRGLPLCQALSPPRTQLDLEVGQQWGKPGGLDSPVRPLWTVTARDASGRDEAYLMGDAQTGRWLLISNAAFVTGVTEDGIRDAAGAEAAARGWLRRLGMQGPFRQERAPVRRGRDWDVWLADGSERLRVQLCRASGDLVLVRRLPPLGEKRQPRRSASNGERVP